MVNEDRELVYFLSPSLIVGILLHLFEKPLIPWIRINDAFSNMLGQELGKRAARYKNSHL